MNPDFIVLGAPKCGTSSLYQYLNQHPDIFLCPKETHYFVSGDERHSHVVVRDWNTYQSLFKTASVGQMTGEVAVRYMYSENALELIRNRLPRVKLLILVRNPVDRAFSQFLMRFRTGGGRVTKGRTVPNTEDIQESFSDLKEEYIQWGRYAHFLSPWYNSFAKEQIAIFKLEHFALNSDTVMSQIFSFIGVDPTVSIDTSSEYNVSTVKDFNPTLVRLKRIKVLRSLRNNKAILNTVSRVIPRKLMDQLLWRTRSESPHIRNVVQLPSDIRSRLLDYYQDDISMLEQLSGLNFEDWRRIPS